jgi:hypothetical protein
LDTQEYLNSIEILENDYACINHQTDTQEYLKILLENNTSERITESTNILESNTNNDDFASIDDESQKQ